MNWGIAEWAFLLSAISTASSVAAWYVAYKSHNVAARSARLAEQQHDLRKPMLVGYLANAEFTSNEVNRVYQFSISISNRSDNNNSVANIELAVTYRTPDGVQVTARLPLAMTPTSLQTPIDVDAHKTVSGLAVFLADHALLESMIIDRYAIIMTDAHAEEFQLSAHLVMEIVDEESIS